MIHPPILSKLGEVPWKNLDDANGKADLVPELIQSLTDRNAERWVPAIEELWDRLDQGVVYEATPEAVPFLASLVSSSSTRCAHQILELLADIASACAYWLSVDRTPWIMAPAERDWYDTVLSRTRSATVAAIEEVGKHTKDLDVRGRTSVGYFLGSAAKLGTDNLPDADSLYKILQTMLEQDAYPFVRASAALAMGAFVRSHPKAVVELTRATTGQHSRTVRICAAVALCKIATLPDEAITVLNDAVRNPTETDNLFTSREGLEEWSASRTGKTYEQLGFDATSLKNARWFPWFHSRPFFHVLSAICATAPANVSRVLPTLVEALRRSAEGEFHLVCEPVLRFVFAETGGKVAGSLTHAQAAALRALGETPTMWSKREIRRDVVLHELGLPTDRDDIRVLVRPYPV